ncbi:MAG: LacI family transcriptional regulator [Caldilinea sp. CFX5]|nr:LacI family transcriptional regulator [Caldilinea sp. CFX5]
MSKRVTLKDVAAQVGVSYQTVSKVLNGQATVTPETATAIREAVNALGYRTNVTARNLRKQASHLIGYSWEPTTPDRVSAILDQFLGSTVEAAEAAGYHVLLFPSHKSNDQSAVYHDLIRTGRVDGFIITSTNYDDPRIRLLRQLDFPFVAFGRANPDWRFPYVDVDGRAGLRAATEHLLEQGHRRIALLAWPEGSRTGTSRVNGYLDALRNAGITVDPAWLRRGEGEVPVGYAQTAALLQLPEAIRPTAIAAVDDHLAIGAMQAVQAAGLKVGADVAVTGFDDTPGVQHLSPPLTSVRQPVREVGREIVNLLTQLIQGETPAYTQLHLPPRLIVRQSSVCQ